MAFRVVIEKLLSFCGQYPVKVPRYSLAQDQTAMRRLAYALALVIAAGSLSLPLLTRPVQAQNSNAAAIEACMREIRSALKAGQKLTEQQRMVAEEQCRARAEASQPKK
jgi:hypothetical protein